MNYYTKIMLATWVSALIAASTVFADENPAPTKEATLHIMQKVADWQLAHPSKHAPTDWTTGALDAGMMALGDLSADPKYRDAMRAAGQTTEWKPGVRTYHADDYCVGQMYCEMYSLYRDPAILAPLRRSFDSILAQPSPGEVEETIKAEGIPAGKMRWWWCDALFMGPPAWARLYSATGEKKIPRFPAPRMVGDLRFPFRQGGSSLLPR